MEEEEKRKRKERAILLLLFSFSFSASGRWGGGYPPPPPLSHTSSDPIQAFSRRRLLFFALFYAGKNMWRGEKRACGFLFLKNPLSGGLYLGGVSRGRLLEKMPTFCADIRSGRSFVL